jgi:hypothetical protein
VTSKLARQPQPESIGEFMRPKIAGVLSAVTMLVLAVLAPNTTAGARTAAPPTIASTQDPSVGPAYVGSPARPEPLPANPAFVPSVKDMHGDGGNTNSSPDAGPLGTKPSVGSAAVQLSPLLTDRAGRLTAGFVNTSGSTPRYAVVAADPHTLQVLAEWDAPEGQTLNLGYMYENTQNQVLVTSREGHVYVVARCDRASGPALSPLRDVDLVAAGVLGAGQSLLNAAFDAEGNIWFTTGGILGLKQDPGTSTTVGYIDPSGRVRARAIPDRAVENGIAVNGTTAYVVTGPVADAPANATGTMYAFGIGGDTGVVTSWSENYQAGSAVKPGGFARGSGATPTLLGGRYVAITDNADNQVNVLVYRQGALGAGQSRLACSVPLFAPGTSANDIGLVGAEADGEDGIIALDDYHAPPFVGAPADVNGSFNDVGGMAPGVEKLTVVPGSGCQVSWTVPVRIKSVPTLSTATGLVYGYLQDADLANRGLYVWYFVALDYRTGTVVWKIRSGAGGTFNDDYKAAAIGPDGTLYQGVLGGVAMLEDGSAQDPSALVRHL